MKKLIYLFILITVIISCNSADLDIQGEYEFITDYTTTITVGGVVGITQRTFYTGETYNGTDKGDSTINIRFLEHTELNDSPSNSAQFQETVDVPRNYLKPIK